MRPLPALYAVLWVAACLGFAVLAAFAAANDTFPADVWLTHRLQDVHSAAFADVLNWTEDMAQVPAIAFITLAAALGALYAGGRGPAVLVAATLIARPLNSVIKEIVERPRPSAELVRVHDQPSDFSFPSGHAHNALLLYGLLFYLAAVYVPAAWVRLPLQALCLWLIIGNGLERVYAGDHWPSDVLGGFYIGALLLAALIAVHRLVIAPRRGVTGGAAGRS
ncbi:MAG: phosphatase PAP2 family protein [Dehalococcoidia bacterium]|nr:phosphatase PAP2 family protein [Dehalococcoidia bacterium]